MEGDLEEASLVWGGMAGAPPATESVSPSHRPTPRERRADDRRLRESEERYRALITATAQMIWTADPSGMTDPDVPTWCAYTGQTAEEAAGTGWLDAVHPDDRAETTRLWQRSVETRTLFETEYRVRRSDGVYRTFLARGVPVLEADGNVREWVGICQDVTERVRAEEERVLLLDRERAARAEAVARAHQLEAIFEAIGDGVIAYDRAGRVVRSNTAARSLLALDEDDDVTLHEGTERAARFEMRDETGALIPRERWPLVRILSGEALTGSRSVDVILRALDGREIQLSVSGAPVHDEEGIAGAVIMLRDVTERRQLERRTHDALDALLHMAETLVFDVGERQDTRRDGGRGQGETDGVAHRLAELACSVLGCRRVSIVAIDPETGTQHPIAAVGLSPEMAQRWRAHVAGRPFGQDPSDALFVDRLRAGETIMLDRDQPPYSERPNPFGVHTVLAAPLRIGEGLVGVLTLDHGGMAYTYTPEEVTLAGAIGQLMALAIERERLLREREEARANELALREANRRMDEFLSIASHELKTPLTTIKGNIQLAELRTRRANVAGVDAGGTAAAQDAGVMATALAAVGELLLRTDRQVGRLNRLVDDLLDVSRIQAGHLEMVLAPCDFAAIVRESVEEQRQAWPRRTIRLDLGADAAPVQADADRIGQVVTNFLTNALKYSDDDRPVEVSLRRDGAELRLRVRDEGPGLDARGRAAVWDRFRRVQGVTVRSGGQGGAVGLGLGLYISKTIVERHGGRVGVDSTPGQGSAFWFSLPSD